MTSLRSQIVSCNNPTQLAVNAETVSEMLKVIWDLQDALSRSQRRFEKAGAILRKSASEIETLVEDRKD